MTATAEQAEATLEVLRLQNMEVSTSAVALAMREDAIGFSTMITKVETEDQNEVAVKAQESLAYLVRGCEKARQEIKEPVLDLCRRIDAQAKTFSEPIKTELTRLSAVVGDYQALLLARQRASEAALRADLEELERQKQAELSRSTSLEEHQVIKERYDQMSECLPPAVAPARADRQVVKEDWDVIVTNPYDLARFHPMCVRIEPRISEIKALLNAGIEKIPGVTAKRIVKTGVR